jgi:hypothetical protein
MVTQVNYDFTIDNYILDAHRILVRIGKSGFVGNNLGIEKNNIGPSPFANHSPISQTETLRAEGGHFPDRFLK